VNTPSTVKHRGLGLAANGAHGDVFHSQERSWSAVANATAVASEGAKHRRAVCFCHFNQMPRSRY
jgi:hypothetical protein